MPRKPARRKSATNTNYIVYAKLELRSVKLSTRKQADALAKKMRARNATVRIVKTR